MQKSKKAKINEKFRSDYLAVNIRETDIYEEGRTKGAEQKAIETAKQGLILNLSYEQISQLVGLPLEIVEQLAKEQTSQNQRKIQE